MQNNKQKLITALASLHSITAKYNDLCDSSISNELQTEGFYSSGQVTEHLELLQQESRNLKIGIIGRVNAGKSSLINALLFDGDDVLPKAATPMTAALTSIGYNKTFTAEVQFFGAEDIAQLKLKAEEYEREVERSFNTDKAQMAERQRNSNRPLPPINDEQLLIKARRKIAENGALAAAADLYQRIKASSLDIASLGESRQLTADSAAALKTQLMDFVGASGRYMPFTREMKLGMPLDSLKGIEVLDTPGVNDPVKSREQRTYEHLKECNAAFIVSPAGQFISEQDFELADRLSAKDGTQEIFIVASQADTQLHASIKSDAKGVLPDAVELLRRTMAAQATKALSQCNNEVLKRIAAQQNQRLILTSGICETLLLGEGSSNDANAQHAMGLLQKNYPDYFAHADQIAANLALLSGRKQLEAAIESVRQKKAQILAEQASHFVDAQWQTLITVKANVLAKLAQLRHEVENTDKVQVEAKLATLKAAATKGEAVANRVFVDQLTELRLTLPKELGQVILDAIKIVDDKAEQAEGSEQETRKVEKSGFLSSFARFVWGGGSEERSETIITLQPLPVRRALEGLARLMQNGMQDCTTKLMLGWRTELVTGLTKVLRDVVGDAVIDISRLQSVCRNVVTKMVELPAVNIPSLPAELRKSNKLKGSDAEEYIEAAQAYASLLEKCGYGFIDDVKNALTLMLKQQIGADILADLVAETQNLQLMIETKMLTLEKMKRMQSELQEI